jgi:transcriptional regulator with XRE-family HTH domain
VETIGQRIARFRKARGLARAELAERVGTSETYIGHWETGYRRPSMESCITLADALGVSLDELVRGTNPNALRAATSSTNEPVVAALEGVA